MLRKRPRSPRYACSTYSDNDSAMFDNIMNVCITTCISRRTHPFFRVSFCFHVVLKGNYSMYVLVGHCQGCFRYVLMFANCHTGSQAKRIRLIVPRPVSFCNTALYYINTYLAEFKYLTIRFQLVKWVRVSLAEIGVRATESAKQDQTARMCSLILLCTLLKILTWSWSAGLELSSHKALRPLDIVCFGSAPDSFYCYTLLKKLFLLSS